MLSLAYPDRSFLRIEECFSQEADSIPKETMTAKKPLLPQSTEKENTKITSGIGARDIEFVKPHTNSTDESQQLTQPEHPVTN